MSQTEPKRTSSEHAGSEGDKFVPKVQDPEKVDDTVNEPEQKKEYIRGVKFLLIFAGIFCSVFIVALDNTILATAIPSIVSDFNSLSKVAWLITVYMLTQAGFMLTGGQLLTLVPTKWLYIACIFVFEIGSLLCAAAPSMNVLILGRAVAGVGAGVIFTCALTVLGEIAPLDERPIHFGILGGLFSLCSVTGPLLGGAFTDNLTWRWCFWINLPVGGVAMGLILLLVPARPPTSTPGVVIPTGFRKWKKVDWIGTILCLAMVTALLLPLQWGGQERPWNDGVVIALFCVFGVLLAAFLFWERRAGDDAILPLSMFRNRTQIGTSLVGFFVFANLVLAGNYLPLWYQAKGHSATRSGVDIIALQLAVIVTSVFGGVIVKTTGRYLHILIATPLLVPVASGLLYTIDADTSTAKLIGYQVLLGVGVGGFQFAMIAIQAEYSDNEAKAAHATAIVLWAQYLGGIIVIAVATAIFTNGLAEKLPVELPEEIKKLVRQSVQVIFTLPKEQQIVVIDAYIEAISRVFLWGVPAGVLGAVSALLIKNHDVREKSKTAGAVAM